MANKSWTRALALKPLLGAHGAVLLLLGCVNDGATDLRHPAPSASGVENPAAPNIILMIADDMGYGDVGYNGGVIDTPNIDLLADTGVILANYYTNPTCVATRLSLFTGRPVEYYGWRWIGSSVGYLLPGAELTFGERFQAAGYDTALLGKWHLGATRSEHHPLLQGFDSFFGMLGGRIGYTTHYSGVVHDWQRDGVSDKKPGYSTILLGEEAVDLIRRRDRTRPFLVVISFNAPHIPVSAPAELEEKYLKRFEATGRERPSAGHAAAVEMLDREVGHVLDTLEAEGIRRETLVIFVSDNGGDGSADNGEFQGSKGTTFEGGIHVPAVASWPGTLPEGVVVDQRMREYDWFATLQAAADLEIEAPSESVNVWPIFRGAPRREREPFVFISRTVQRGNPIKLRSIISGDLKLLYVKSGNNPGWHRRLYDLSRDPSERSPLDLDVHAEQVTAFDEMLAEYLEHYPGPNVLPLANVVPEGVTDMTEMLEDPHVLEDHLENR